MSASVSPAGRRAMADLAEALEACGYAECYAALCGPGIFPAEPRRAAAAADGLDAEARGLLRLLAFDLPVARAEAPARLVALLTALAEAGLATEVAGAWRSNDLVVVPVLGGYLLTATPPGWRAETERSGRAYLGDDSLRLARALPDATGRSVLDLGTGCGVQGLLAARGARHVVLSDVEARSLELAGLNAVLNGDPDELEIVAGDCYEPVAGRRFDLVVTLPPYLPSPPSLATSVVAAGVDGLGLLRRIVAEADEHLAPGGELLSFAQLLCDDDGPLLGAELPSLAPDLEARLLCHDWHPLQPFALELATKLAAVGGRDRRAVLGSLLASFRERGATGVCTAHLRLRAPRVGEAGHGGRLETNGLARLRPGAVLAPAAGLDVSPASDIVQASAASGASQLLPAHVAALLGQLDGVRSIAQAADAAWGSPAGADPADLLDQALERAGALVAAGLLLAVRP